MKKYFSTFITGFAQVIENTLKSEIKDINILKVFDGLIIYETKLGSEKIKQLPFFNNSYFLINYFDDLNSENGINEMISHFKQNELPLNLKTQIKGKTFRFVFSKENQTISINKERLGKLEKKLSIELNLSVNRTNPDLEFWFLSRKEGIGLIGIRFTRHGDYEKILEKGELRPELIFLLCLLSEPNRDDILLDPFAGSGSIPLTLAKNFPHTTIIASDNNQNIIGKLKEKIERLNINIQIKNFDALNLFEIPDSSITKIITDPPWGLYFNEISDLNSFYTKMLKEFNRILQPDGLLIIIISQKDLFEKALSKFTRLRPQERYHTLVNGQKASVYKIKVK